jgi:hypothetical protein
MSLFKRRATPTDTLKFGDGHMPVHISTDTRDGFPVHHSPPPLSRDSPSPARIIVPFTKVHPDTRAALKPYGSRVEYVDVRADGAYWSLFRDLWAAGEDFILVEHDIVPHVGTIEHFDRCPSSWCSCPYHWKWKPQYNWLADRSSKVIDNSLGCVRFRSEFLKQCPDLGSDAVLERFKHIGDQLEYRKNDHKTPGITGPIPYFLVDSIFLGVVFFGQKYAHCVHEQVGHRQ